MIMQQVTLDEIVVAESIVYTEMKANPQYCWPLLCKLLDTKVWVKHENHTPNGALKSTAGWPISLILQTRLQSQQVWSAWPVEIMVILWY